MENVLELGLKSANRALKVKDASDKVTYITFAAARAVGYKFDFKVRQTKTDPDGLAKGRISKPYIAYSEPDDTTAYSASLSVTLQEEGLKNGDVIDPTKHQLVMWINDNNELVHTIGKIGEGINLK